MLDRNVVDAWKVLHYHKQKAERAAEAMKYANELYDCLTTLPEGHSRCIEIKVPTRSSYRTLTLTVEESEIILRQLTYIRNRVSDEAEEAFNSIDLEVISGYSAEDIPDGEL